MRKLSELREKIIKLMYMYHEDFSEIDMLSVLDSIFMYFVYKIFEKKSIKECENFLVKVNNIRKNVILKTLKEGGDKK